MLTPPRAQASGHSRCCIKKILLLAVRWVCWGAVLLAAPCSAQEEAHYCGPDLTEWLLQEMNVNAVSDEIAYLYEISRPPTLRSTAERMLLFADLVGPGKQWDHKHRILNLLQAGLLEGACPTSPCSYAITLCGACYNYDVFSNIHYGFIGRVAGFKRSVLIVAPVVVQEGGDTPREKIKLEAEDTPAVLVGQDVYRQVWWQRLLDPVSNPWPGWVTREQLCGAIERRASRLADRFVAPECLPCEQSWLP